MSTTLFGYATVAAPIFRRGWEMGEFGGMGLARVLVLEEAGAASHLAHVLGNAGFACETVSSISAALAVIENRGADVLICGAREDVAGGVDFVRIMRSRKPDLPLILLADDPNVATAVAAIRQGAFDGSVLI
jgi:DNA-binding NtrC family response regulator